MCRTNIDEIIDDLLIVKIDEIENDVINRFRSKIQEYTEYLSLFAKLYESQNVSRTHLLISKTHDVIAYITIIADAVTVLPNEKEKDGLKDIPFSIIPSVKIAKLAVDEEYRTKYHGIGTYMIEVARAIAFEINRFGVACRYLTVDADIEHDPGVIQFYEKIGFIRNENYIKGKRRTISMRLDLFYE